MTFGGAAFARYWINRRSVQRKWYNNVFAELETVEKQNAVFYPMCFISFAHPSIW